jgi:aspartate aminotransferase
MWKAINDLNEFFEPQEKFDRLMSATFRQFGPNVVDLSYANAYEGPDEQVLRALELSIREDKELSFQYTPYGGRTTTRRLVASKLIQEYKLPFNYRDIILTPGAMAALNIVFRTLFGPEDEVVVLTPCWLDYPLYLGNLGIPIRFVALNEDKHFDLTLIREALRAKTRGILFSHPSCPSGVLYPKEEIDGLSGLLVEAEKRFGTRIYLISDEVHRHIIWSGDPFYSPLLSYPRALSIYSFGKALFLQGQRIGYVAVSPQMPENRKIRGHLERCVRMMGFCTPTNLMQRAICRLLDYQPCLDRIARLQETVRVELEKYGYEVCRGEATFFVYVKSPLLDDFEFAEFLASHGVLVTPSTLFHERGYFRISVAARPESIMRALPVFEKVLEKVTAQDHA